MLRIAKFVGKKTPGYERILREADFMKNLKHSGIPLVYDIIEDSDSICIIEEFISGKSLTEYVAEKGNLEAAEVIAFTEQICKILEYLHGQDCRGILHLDLKPDHIFIDASHMVKVIDFDSAMRSGENNQSSYGSVGFAAPEQYHRLHLDSRADIYSLGMLILYMDCGHIQSSAETLHHKQFYPIVKKCIHHNPLQRYQSAEHVRKAICGVKAKKEVLETGESQKIYVYGIKRGIGTTHICLCLTSFLVRRGFRAVCIQQSDEEDIISEAVKGTLQCDGTFLYQGIPLCPAYQEAVQADLNAYEYLVMDCGIEPDLPLSADLKIAVTDFGYRKRQERQALEQTDKKSLIFVNHTGGDAFYQELKNVEADRRYFRIPCVYDWWKSSKILDIVLEEAMSEGFSENFTVKKKGGGAADWAKFIRKKLPKKSRSKQSEENCPVQS